MRENAQDKANRSNPNPGIITGVCIECALCYHDFKELIGRAAEEGPPSEAALSSAWIDGRRHSLLSSLGTLPMICRECRKRVETLYIRSD